MERIPPFQVGDKVVRIGESHPEYNMYTGRIYTVSWIVYCCEKMGWRLDLEETSNPFISATSECEACGKITTPLWRAVYFRKPDEIPSNYTIESLLQELQVPVKELVPV